MHLGEWWQGMKAVPTAVTVTHSMPWPTLSMSSLILSPTEMLSTLPILRMFEPAGAAAERRPCVPGLPTAVTVATSSGLRYGIKDTARRTVIANYIDVVAAVAVRATNGTPSPADLSTAITNAIPASIKADFPEIVAFVVPIIVSNYEIAYTHFGANAAKLYAVLNDIATGLEAGAAPYISPPKTTSP